MMGEPVNLCNRPLVYIWLDAIAGALHPALCPLCGDRVVEDGLTCVHSSCDPFLPRQGPSCLQCALPLPADNTRGLCGSCIKSPPHFDSALAPFEYRSPVSQWIQALKFQRRIANARLLARLMARYLIGARAPRPQALVPVPLHHWRLRRRGYNQSAEIARYLNQLLGVPVHTGLMKRKRKTEEQSGLSAAQRRRNVKGAFAVNATRLPTHIALIDDVMTTGTTVNECARVLKEAGVEQVDVWAVARAVKS